MENQELDLVKVQSEVTKATRLSVTKKELEDMVAISSKITVPDLTNKSQVAIAKESRLKLRKVEIDIEKQGKGYRDIFTAVNKAILADEKELKAITSPEIERIEKIEEEARKIEIILERTAQLPFRYEQLSVIDDGIEVTDAELLEMDAQTFTDYKNSRIAQKLEDDRTALEAEQAKVRAEAERQERENATREREEIARKEEQELSIKRLEIEKQNAELRIQQEKAEADRRVKEAEEKAKQEAKEKEERIQQEKLMKEVKEREEKEKLESKKKYQEWLIKNDYNEATHYLRNENGIITLYKAVSTFKI